MYEYDGTICAGYRLRRVSNDGGWWSSYLREKIPLFWYLGEKFQMSRRTSARVSWRQPPRKSVNTGNTKITRKVVDTLQRKIAFAVVFGP